MDSIKKRLLTFLVACIGLRSIFVYVAKTIDKEKLPYLGYLAIIPAIGFWAIYLGGLRPTGFEAGGEIWWNHLRPAHGTLYGIFAYLAINKSPHAWKVLLADVLIGLSFFLNFHYKSGDLVNLFN